MLFRSDRIRRAYQLVLGREPKPFETTRARLFLKDQSEKICQEKSQPSGHQGELPYRDRADAAAWVDLSLALLNSNEFVYVP